MLPLSGELILMFLIIIIMFFLYGKMVMMLMMKLLIMMILIFMIFVSKQFHWSYTFMPMVLTCCYDFDFDIFIVILIFSLLSCPGMISIMTAFTNTSTMSFSLGLNQQVFISTWLINNFSQQVQIRSDQSYKFLLKAFLRGWFPWGNALWRTSLHVWCKELNVLSKPKPEKVKVDVHC